MADLTQVYKNALMRTLELMGYGMMRVIVNQWEKVRAFSEMIVEHSITHVEQKESWNTINRIGTRELSTRRGRCEQHASPTENWYPAWMGAVHGCGNQQEVSEWSVCVVGWGGGAGTSRGRNGVTRAFWELLEAWLGRAVGTQPHWAGGARTQSPLPLCLGLLSFLPWLIPAREKGSRGLARGLGEADPTPFVLRYLRQLPHTSVRQTLRLLGEETEAYAPGK